MASPDSTNCQLRFCLRDPIPEIAVAAQYLDDAVAAHLAGDTKRAETLIKLADLPVIREWTESILGSKSAYLQLRRMPDNPPGIPRESRVKMRMPSASEQRELHVRDGYHCRFCGIPVIRKKTRVLIMRHYPDALSWGKRNLERHAAFQTMWAQYDHLLPHAKGGTNALDNVVVSCAPCNFGRGGYTLAETGLCNPLERAPVMSSWDGLERFSQVRLSGGRSVRQRWP